MPIQINGQDVIGDDYAVTNIVSSEAEAKAGTNNDSVMTPLRVLQAIEHYHSQDEDEEVIKTIQRFTVEMGILTVGGVQYYTWGAASVQGFSSYPGPMTVFTPGPEASFCFVNLNQTVDPGKSFITVTYSGDGNGSQCAARLYRWGGGSGGYSGAEVQVTQSQYIPVPSGNFIYRGPPAAMIEVIEYK
jgi:hypothetical protein